MPARRYAAAGLVALIGIMLSMVVWLWTEGERRSGIIGLLGPLSDRSTSALEKAMDREVEGLRGLGAMWEIHDPVISKTWPFETGVVLGQFTGVRWIAWVPREGGVTFVGRDTSARIDAQLLKQARFQVNATTPAFRERWKNAYDFDVLLPVRNARRPIGVVVGGIRIDSLWLARQPTFSGFRTVRLLNESDQPVVLHNMPDSLAPTWMHMRRTLTTPAGSNLTVEWVPTNDFVRQIMTPWPLLFLITGSFLSLALGALVLSFMQVREFSEALQATNRVLDRRVTDLSKRDHELSELNAELGDRVQQRTAELSRALRELEMFNHSVSHDLRSPLGAILNFTAVLKEDYGMQMDAEGTRLLDRISAAAYRANGLLDSLAEFSATETTIEESRTLNMKDIAERAFVEAVGNDGDGGNVTFQVRALPEATGDPALVHRVFVNLIGNALKYSRHQSARTLEVTGQANGKESTFAVRDNGRGFDPTRTSEVFEPFNRLHESDVEGSGLGLAIVAKIIGRLGGRVWAESDGATGATFYFTLPRAQGQA